MKKTIAVRVRKADARQTSIPLKSAIPPEDRKAFTLDEFAQLVGISYTTAWRLYQRGKLKRCGYTRNILISNDEVNRFTRSQEVA